MKAPGNNKNVSKNLEKLEPCGSTSMNAKWCQCYGGEHDGGS